MAGKVKVDPDLFSCTICLDLLKEPVTLSCGHSYCKRCIQVFWDQRANCVCPNCMAVFRERPALVKNVTLAYLGEDLRRDEQRIERCQAGPQDTPCDVCLDRKLIALKFCLDCMACYCEEHLHGHFYAAGLMHHKLVELSDRFHYICPHHGEVMKMFCCSDQQGICYVCAVEEHRGHNMVSAAAERAKKQPQLKMAQRKLRRMIQSRVKDLRAALQIKTINIPTETGGTRVMGAKGMQRQLKKEVAELRGNLAELERLSFSNDDVHFLQNYQQLNQHQSLSWLFSGRL